MSRKDLELLAPAGKWESLEKVIEKGADAVYLGGKRFNMRLLRPDFNFSDEKIKEAVSYAHDRGVKVYVTVNNLYFQSELTELVDYLGFLQEAGCDGVIVQDLALPLLAQRYGIRLPLHASVQMGVGSAEAAKLLEEHGFSRCILSKNLSLDEIAGIHRETSMQLEFFVHGDVCISHTGQCYMSSFFFGESGNRGRCRKPCRWKYHLASSQGEEKGPLYFLAHKDLCLIAHLDGLIKAGIRSFKIEGRMRDPEYAGFLVGCYRRALDALEAGDFENIKSIESELYSRRIRDFTIGGIYGKTGVGDIGYSGEREPFFPTSSIELTPLDRDDYSEPDAAQASSVPSLSVKVGNMRAFSVALSRGADAIIVGGDTFRDEGDVWNRDSLIKAIQMGKDKGVSVVVEAPRIVTQKDLKRLKQFLAIPEIGASTAVMVHDLGSLRVARELGHQVWAGYGLNLTNAAAAEFLSLLGVRRATVSLEMKLSDIKDIAKTSPVDVELVVQGPLCGMITDYCPIQSLRDDHGNEGCQADCSRGDYYLVDEYEQRFYLLTDYECRTHIYFPLDLCLYGYLPLVSGIGIKSIRIEGHRYRPDTLAEVIDIYRDGLRDLKEGEWEGQKRYRRLLRLFPHGLTANPFIPRLGALATD